MYSYAQHISGSTTHSNKIPTAVPMLWGQGTQCATSETTRYKRKLEIQYGGHKTEVVIIRITGRSVISNDNTNMM